MPFFRKDPFGPAWVLISPERGLEASDFGSVQLPADVSPLSPGNEHTVGRELLAVRPGGPAAAGADWQMRVIEHPYALVQPRAFTVHGDDLFRYAPSSGYQEIIVEHPDPRTRLDTMPREHLEAVLKLYCRRLDYLGSRPGIRHLQLSRNVGRAAGALFDHPHAQLLAVPVPNRWVDEEITAAKAHHQATGRCLFCDVLDAEIAQRERLVSQNQGFAAIAPYAAKTPFETWILPRRHDSAFTGVASNDLPQLAELLQTVVRAINAALDHPPYNLILHTLPDPGQESYHWHFEILPRLTHHAGFDWANGFYVNPTPPEDAARFLREALAMQEVAP